METEPEMETDTEPENGNRNGTVNIRDFGLSTPIHSFVLVISSVCLSVYFLDVWCFLYLPTLFVSTQIYRTANVEIKLKAKIHGVARKLGHGLPPLKKEIRKT